MQDDDDLDGLSPTSMWRRSKKRKDYSDVEEEDDDKGEHVEDDEDGEEEEEDHNHITNEEHKGKLHPTHVPLAVVRMVPPPKKMRQTARMNTGGKAPRHCLASRNPVINLLC
jgi:hypothetical protein